MAKKEIVVLTDVALITAIVQRGKADAIVKAAQEAGAQGASIHYSHGRGVRERLGILGLAVEAEKEVINIIVSRDQTDRIFEKIYLAGDFDTPGMGFMWVTPVEKAATFVPPDILEKFAQQDRRSPERRRRS
ncbi:P-II family nitrogen regulator [Aestuariirhabdus litorea]|uniref:P-II family nitrogen regulator n=1 Tax=Aestuariirhabdus litorea TaxID=2528527 RepID=A0A3P3VSL1_9GAMM|nr:P-II family nitrogen regulator [Aestuariirhabdus litorea]RRJ83773.1 P-II family nitrogen regulator [Aestuariirhabdus litorea]RWW96996.1 P-II family nitrogen regulator [Endozoicomonadaceae bacterium GTF-13]